MDIIVAISGGIAAYKSVDVISALKKNDFTVAAMTTPNALNFVTVSTIRNTADKYWEMDWGKPVHIEATDELAKAFIVVPATANTLAKMANGIADNLVTDTYLAVPPQVLKIVCPAMNTRMLNHPSVIENLQVLKNDGVQVIEPVEGHLACGTVGKGKLMSTRDLVTHMIDLIDKADMKNE